MNPETIIESVEFLKHKGITAPEVGIVLVLDLDNSSMKLQLNQKYIIITYHIFHWQQ